MFPSKHLFVIAVFGLTSIWSSITLAQELRYQMEPQQKFSYDIVITVDTSEQITTFKGIVHYTVNSANAEQFQFTYRGGLSESVVPKQTNRNNGGMRGFPGPPFGRAGFPGIPSPFSRPTFAGKVQTTNRITMTPYGRVLSMEGDSQLPYLLGNVSLLPFEMLPKDNQREWTLDSGVSISEESQSQRPFGAFGPFSNQGEKSVQSATEITRYSITNEQGNLVSIKKSYQLTAPPAGDGESFDMNGAGAWTFNKADHLPESSDMSFKLIAKEGNSSTTFPITVKFTRLSAADIERMEAEAARIKAENEAKAAAAKAKAEAPLTPEETKNYLLILSKNNTAEIITSLNELSAKTPLEPDPKIAAAIQKRLKDSDKKVADAAKKALMNWSPDFKRKQNLAKAYEGPSPVDSTDLEVDSQTPLYVGQILQAQEHGAFWKPVQIKALLPDKRVEVQYLSWGKPDRSVTLTRRNLQLAPPELEQPNKPARMPTPATSSVADGTTAPSNSTEGIRTWSDATGRFKIEAEYVSMEGDKVKLRRADGRSIEIAIDKLSPVDQAFAKKRLEEDSPDNPFKLK